MKKIITIILAMAAVTAGLIAEGGVDFSGQIETAWGLGRRGAGASP